MSASVTVFASDTNTPLVPAELAASVVAAVLSRVVLSVPTPVCHTSSLHDALPISAAPVMLPAEVSTVAAPVLPTLFAPIEMLPVGAVDHIVELQVLVQLVPTVLLEPAVTS